MTSGPKCRTYPVRDAGGPPKTFHKQEIHAYR
ncbi:hypothetical protein ABIB29_001557 [Arthrobacter sp. UYEF36]